MTAELKSRIGETWRDRAPLSAAAAATQILNGLRADKTRVLVGEDAIVIDMLCRARLCSCCFVLCRTVLTVCGIDVGPTTDVSKTGL